MPEHEGAQQRGRLREARDKWKAFLKQFTSFGSVTTCSRSTRLRENIELEGSAKLLFDDGGKLSSVRLLSFNEYEPKLTQTPWGSDW